MERPSLLLSSLCIALVVPGTLAVPRAHGQCLPPAAGTYTLSVSLPPGPALACPATSVAIDIVGDGGAVGIQGYTFNLAIGGAGTIISVAPASALGGFFFVSGTEVGGLGAAPAGVGPIAGPVTLATVLFQPALVGTPQVWSVDFSGTVALPSGFPILNSLVASNGCDALPPLLGLAGASLGISPCPGNFIRGDCNQNGQVGGLVGDILFILNFLFAGGAVPGCLNACDSNDDNLLDFTDAVLLLNWTALGGPAPPPPTPVVGAGLAACGPDLTPGPLTCAAGVCP